MRYSALCEMLRMHEWEALVLQEQRRPPQQNCAHACSNNMLNMGVIAKFLVAFHTTPHILS